MEVHKYIYFLLFLVSWLFEIVAVRPLGKVLTYRESMFREDHTVVPTHCLTTLLYKREGLKKRLSKKKVKDSTINIPIISIPAKDSSTLPQLSSGSQRVVDMLKEVVSLPDVLYLLLLSYMSHGGYVCQNEIRIAGLFNSEDQDRPPCVRVRYPKNDQLAKGICANVYITEQRGSYDCQGTFFGKGTFQFIPMPLRVDTRIVTNAFYGFSPHCTMEPCQFNLCDDAQITERRAPNHALMSKIADFHTIPSLRNTWWHNPPIHNVIQCFNNSVIAWHAHEVDLYHIDDNNAVDMQVGSKAPKGYHFDQTTNHNIVIEPSKTMLLRCAKDSTEESAGERTVFRFGMNTLECLEEVPDLAHKVTDDLICLDDDKVLLFSTEGTNLLIRQFEKEKLR